MKKHTRVKVIFLRSSMVVAAAAALSVGSIACVSEDANASSESMDERLRNSRRADPSAPAVTGDSAPPTVATPPSTTDSAPPPPPPTDTASFSQVLRVGPGQAHATPCAAIAVAPPGALVEVDAAGSYDGNTCAWTTDDLTVRGVNGRARIDLAGVTPSQQKGIFTISAPRATIENFEFSNAAIASDAGGNAAGIRHQGSNLIVRGCYFHDNQNGILGAPATALSGSVLIESSEFARNGTGDGYTHNLYLGDYAEFTLRHSYSHAANSGHLVKSRAMKNVVLYNRLTDENGTASYELDLPNGGMSTVIGNVIEQSAATQNGNIVSYAAEGVSAGYDSHLTMVNNTILNSRGAGTFVVVATSTPAVLTNNVFFGGGTVTSQAGAIQTSNFVGDPGFVDRGAFDVRLAAGSAAIDQGSDPGAALTPTSEYLGPASGQSRPVNGAAIDVGAYEAR